MVSGTVARTVSTHRSMSLMNLDDAPKARKTPTPAMVSPYNEYNGERVTESVTRSTLLSDAHEILAQLA